MCEERIKFYAEHGGAKTLISENRTEQRPGKNTLEVEKKPGRCPKPEPLMDPGPAAQTPEAKRRKIKRHAGQMPDTAWPSQGQPKMVGKSKDASHCLSKKRPSRKGRRQRRPEEIDVAIPAGVRQAIRTTTKAQATSSARRRSAARPLQLRTSAQVSCNKVGPPALPPAARLM